MNKTRAMEIEDAIKCRELEIVGLRYELHDIRESCRRIGHQWGETSSEVLKDIPTWDGYGRPKNMAVRNYSRICHSCGLVQSTTDETMGQPDFGDER